MPDEPPSAFVRLFLAITVPPEVREEISRTQGRLKRASPPGAVRWTPPDQFHLTLKFLGDVQTEHIPTLEKATATLCASLPAFQLSARSIGFFPNAHKPRVIWVGANDSDGQLAELHRRLDGALSWLVPAEKAGPFTGHITLGRFKPGHHAAIPRLVAPAADFHARHFGDWQIREVELVRSDLTSVRAEHTTIGRFPLAGQGTYS
jgi:RNA 2',3'-cyclic 3'-phosphodiesterase